MNEKQLVGEKAAEYVKDGMVVGLGTGSTIFYTIKRLSHLVKEGLNIQGIPTSEKTAELAREYGIPLVNFSEIGGIDVAIDGADQVDSDLNLIKGGGGALLREKIIAHSAATFIVIADSSKLAKKLGAFPLPVEIVPFGFEVTARSIQSLGASPKLRMDGEMPFVTDNGNYIFDCDFRVIDAPGTLEYQLNLIPGVVENGLFVNMANKVITLDEKKNIIVKG